ncbi:heterokaryon incompatibility protein-domain-containing protein [Xylariaceae sp. FL1019]|nr:heterokaryon incompatibility protein-domain-containing protein [Xylariaceae sp. FL1019]
MRLLNTTTFELREFLGSSVPEYAILSHTWGQATDEVSYQDLVSERWLSISTPGRDKIQAFCALAREEGYEWGWVDTCCIDKTSSAELSESINSMYRWYKEAHICYALLTDVKVASEIHSARWLTRGWTLQELLAPSEVEFYDSEWNLICTRSEAAKQIAKATDIAVEVLLNQMDIDRYPVATRMSWAANRVTTRAEDTAYCLLGLFEVNMPLLYGEGTRAFRRLQEEILKITEDYTLMAWPGKGQGVLANSPQCFRNESSSRLSSWSYNDIKIIQHNKSYSGRTDSPWPKDLSVKRRDCLSDTTRSNDLDTEFDPPVLTPRGLRVRLPIIEEFLPQDMVLGAQKVFLLFLNCYSQKDNAVVCIRLSPSQREITDTYTGPYNRFEQGALCLVKARQLSVTMRTIYLHVDSSGDLTRNQSLRQNHRRGNYRRGKRSDSQLCVFWFGKAPFPGRFVTRCGGENAPIYLALSRGSAHSFLVCSVAGYPWCKLIRNYEGTLPLNATDIAPKLARKNNTGSTQLSRASILLFSGEQVHCALKRRLPRWLDVQLSKQTPYPGQPGYEKKPDVRQICDCPDSDSLLLRPSWRQGGSWMRDISELYTVQVWIEPETEEPVMMHLWNESDSKWTHWPIERRPSQPSHPGSDAVEAHAPWSGWLGEPRSF